MVQIVGLYTGRVKRLIMFGLAVLLLVFGVLPGSPIVPRKANALGPCQVVNLQPHSAPDGSLTGFAFTITDNTNALAYVQVVSPSGNLVIVNAHSDWLPSASSDPSQATFTGSPIDPGQPIEVDVDGV